LTLNRPRAATAVVLCAFVAIEVVACAYLVVRRGTDIIPLLLLVTAAVAFYGFLGWLAGRHPRAEPTPDPVRSPRLEGFAIAIGYFALLGWSTGVVPIGIYIAVGAAVAWAAVALLNGIRGVDLRWTVRSWRPYLPLLVGVTAPKLILAGAVLPIAVTVALPSGVLQQVLLQVGLTSRLEAIARNAAVAAMIAALAFGLLHAPVNLSLAGGDWAIAVANALVLQTPIGLAFCVAYQRHRAPLALGAVHAIAMA
jgi:hypothetical protein